MRYKYSNSAHCKIHWFRTNLVRIHEDEDIIGANGGHDKDGERIQKVKVLDLKDNSKDEPCHGERKEDFLCGTQHHRVR